MLLTRFLRSLIREGRLDLVEANGRRTSYGRPSAGETDRPPLVLRLRDAAVARRLALNPELALGEAYTEGRLTVEGGSIADLLDLIGRNAARLEESRVVRAMRRAQATARWTQQYNPVSRAQRNIAHHYDLSEALYELFLDTDRQYSCAYFTEPDMSLEAAQRAKLRHIAAKLQIRPGLRILDIGSGWGGLALYLAGLAPDVQVTGITLSREQLEVARRRAESAGLTDRVQFHLRDFREEDGRYDRIVSVGMFEHVGVPHYRRYFGQIETLLEENGVALLHSIGRKTPPGATNPWIRKYIFPGGYIPAMSEVLAAIERTGLWTTDVEVLRLHYAETLKEWRRRFLANRERAAALYDERFCRMWEFYLAGSEMAFRHGGMMVFQMQLARQIDAVPLTRDYIVDSERGQASDETARRASDRKKAPQRLRA